MMPLLLLGLEMDMLVHRDAAGASVTGSCSKAAVVFTTKVAA